MSVCMSVVLKIVKLHGRHTITANGLQVGAVRVFGEGFVGKQMLIWKPARQIY